MSQTPPESERFLASLLSEEQQNAAAASESGDPADEQFDDVDSLIDAMEALVADSRRMPFRKLLVDEEQLIDLVDRLRSAIPAEVRQAHQVLDQHDQILDRAREQARQMLEERGLLDAIDKERSRILGEAEREASRTRAEADRYARSVLVDLEERLGKLHTSVRNGIEALQPPESDSADRPK